MLLLLLKIILLWEIFNWNREVMCFLAGLKASAFDVQLNKTCFSKFNPFSFFFFFSAVQMTCGHNSTLSSCLFLSFLKSITNWLSPKIGLNWKCASVSRRKINFPWTQIVPRSSCRHHYVFFSQWSLLKIIQYSVISVTIPALKQADVFSWADIVAPATEDKYS